MILARIGPVLEEAQPEEQHGFRPGRRLEEHLLTATLMISKTLAADVPIWIVSLDLSKAFDRIEWGPLWRALRDQGISDHMIWLLQCLYQDQSGEVKGHTANSRSFRIKSGVRQGCVLSPRLFTAVLQWAMRSWRASVGQVGFDLGDGLPRLLDLRLADDILLFCRSAQETRATVDSVVWHLANVGLILNAEKAVILTTEAQPPPHIQLADGQFVAVLPRHMPHKWLGCMFSAVGGATSTNNDLNHHLGAASRALFANGWILRDRNVSLCSRLKYFQAIITPVACFAARHRAVYQADLAHMNVEFRRLLRSVVGPPADISWDQPWHEILHLWNAKVRQVCGHYSLSDWPTTALKQYWKLAAYVVSLPQDRWICRVLNWIPDFGRRNAQGQLQQSWDDKLNAYCRWRGLGTWKDTARNSLAWMQPTHG